MYGVRYYVQSVNAFQKINDDGVDFFILVFSTLLIAAGGNIINDYFDVKADRINKPEKLIVTKHIKRRFAILIHWIFNGVGFLMAIYLSVKYESLWFVLIHLYSINILWFYSMLFKRKILIGNLFIASLTALVPLLVMIFFKVSNYNFADFSEFRPESWSAIIDYRFIYVLAIFAFIQNLAREIIKDIQDVKGDQKIFVTSLPMVMGERNSLFVVCALLAILPIFYVWAFINQFKLFIGSDHFFTDTLPFFFAALINVGVIVWIIITRNYPLKTYDGMIKISMLLGVLSTFYIASL